MVSLQQNKDGIYMITIPRKIIKDLQWNKGDQLYTLPSSEGCIIVSKKIMKVKPNGR